MRINGRWAASGVALVAVLSSAASAHASAASAQATDGWSAASASGVGGPVSSFSDSDAWALGSSGFAHWNGASWQQFAAPSSLGTVLAVTDDGPGDAWAVGRIVSGYRASSPQIAHWDGSSWTLSASPAISARFATLSSVAALGRDNAWAVGTDGHSALVEHWDGTAWSRVTVPDPGAGTIYSSRLTALAARSANDIWAVGTFDNPAPAPAQLYALHFDGSRWQNVAMAQTGSVTNSDNPYVASLVATSANDVWMVGSHSSSVTLTEHWNGTAWSIVPSPFNRVGGDVIAGSLAAVTARSSTDVWAAGSYITFHDGDSAPVNHALILHWTGTAWSQDAVPTSGSYNVLQGISTTAAGHRIWATNAGSPNVFQHS